MDTFTRNHLQQYADYTAFDDEREGFVAYVVDALEDDPSLAEMGWPAMLRNYRNSLD